MKSGLYITEVSVDTIMQHNQISNIEEMRIQAVKHCHMACRAVNVIYKTLHSCCIVNSRTQCPKGIIDKSHDQDMRHRAIPHQSLLELTIKTEHPVEVYTIKCLAIKPVQCTYKCIYLLR